MAQTRRIAFNTLVIFVGRALSLLVGIVRLNYVATSLGVTGFGILSFATYFIALFPVLADFGIPSILTRDIAREPGRTARLLWNALLVKSGLVAATGLIIVLILALSGFDGPTTTAVALTGVAFAFTSLTAVFTSALQGHQKMLRLSVVSLSIDVLASLTIIALIEKFPSITTVLAVTIASAMANFAVLGLSVRQLTGPIPRIADLALMKHLLREGYPLALSALGISTYTYVGSTILKYERNDHEVGLYGSAYKLFSILTLIPASFTQVIYPILSAFSETAPQKLSKAFADSLRVMSLISIPVATGGAILAPQITALIFPPQFAAAATALAVLLGSCSLGFLNWVVSTFLLAINRQRFMMSITLAVGAVAIAANLFLVPLLGFEATAMILACTELTIFVSCMIYLPRTGYRIPFSSILFKPVVSSGVMAVGLVLFGHMPVLVLIPGGIVVYGAVTLLLRGLGSQEKELLAAIITRVKVHGHIG